MKEGIKTEEPKLPDYYGTGRQPKSGKPHAGLVIALVAILLAACVMPLVIPRLQPKGEPPERGGPPEGEAPQQRSLVLPEDEDPKEQAAICGMLICELDEVQQRYWDLPNGVIVGQVEANSAAANAGILPGDVIIRVGDAAPDSAKNCCALLTSCSAGGQVQVEIYRSGEEIEVELTCSDE